MVNNNIIKHPSILYNDQLSEICSPLEKLHNIDYFCHVRVDKEGYFSALGKNPQFVERYLAQKYYNCDSHLSIVENHVEYIIQDIVNHKGLTKKLFEDCNEFNIHQVFTILHRGSNGIDAYHFGTSSINKSINDLYLKDICLLQTFIDYFKSNISNNAKLKEAYNTKFKIDKAAAVYQSSHHSTNSRHEFINSISKNKTSPNRLTKRETDCLKMYVGGKSAREIGIAIGLSQRTVENYIQNVKEKLCIHSKSELIIQMGGLFNNQLT